MSNFMKELDKLLDFLNHALKTAPVCLKRTNPVTVTFLLFIERSTFNLAGEHLTPIPI